MSRLPGLPKTGGRKKGTPNRRTESLVEALNAMDFDPIERLIALLNHLEPMEQAEICLAILPYLYPRRKSFEVNTIRNEYADYSEEMLQSELKRLKETLVQLESEYSSLPY